MDLKNCMKLIIALGYGRCETIYRLRTLMECDSAVFPFPSSVMSRSSCLPIFVVLDLFFFLVTFGC